MVLEGQKSLVTGAGRGIGRAIALALAREGADVALAARTRSQLEAVAGEVRALGRDALVLPTDVGDEAQAEACVRATEEAFGHIDVLVNNAASFGGGPVHQLDPATWDRVIETNLRGPFLMSRAALGGMIRRERGTLIMMSSTSGKRADPGGSAYCASKFGLIGFAGSLFAEVRRHNIRVVVIYPSAVDTRPLAPGDMRESGPGVRMRAEDVADAVLAACALPQRALVREIELWGTNP